MKRTTLTDHLTHLLPLTLLLLVTACGNDPVGTTTVSATIKEANEKAIIGTVDWSKANTFPLNTTIGHNGEAVGLIDIPTAGSRCTAFLISRDLIMTNWHCFPKAGSEVGAKLYLQYYDGDSSDSYKQLSSYDCEELLLTYQPLDVAILRCTGAPGQNFGTLKLDVTPEMMSVGSGLYVLHQNCDYYSDENCAPVKRFSPGRVVEAGTAPSPARETDLFYDADTLGGSSGSPVFRTDNHAVVALHHNGHGNFGDGRGTKNSGVPLHKIFTFLKSNYPEIASELSVVNRTVTTTQPTPVAPVTPVTPVAPTLPATLDLHGGLLTIGTKTTQMLVSGDEHYFRVRIDYKRMAEFVMNYKSSLGDLDLYLFDRDQKVVASSESSSNVDTIRTQLPPGTYTLVIAGYNSAGNRYQLSYR